MRSKFLLIALGSALAGCTYMHTPDVPAKGVAAVNVPVVTAQDYVFDAAAPGGVLAASEVARLDGWFQGLGLGYGDNIYVDGGYAPAARNQVAAVASSQTKAVNGSRSPARAWNGAFINCLPSW
jgi:pilus assembly protein CpaD